MISRLTCSALCCCTVLLPRYGSAHDLLSLHIIHAACVQNHPRFLGLYLGTASSMLHAVELVPQMKRKSKGELSMSMKENKELVCRFVEEFWSRGNMAAADELMTADATIFLPGRGQVNKEGFKAFALTLRSAFPDWYSTLEELVAEEDLVAERWT